MIAVTRSYWFSASHRLHLADLSEVENDQLYGKCNNPYGHGHNYRLEVSVTGPVHPVTGQILPAPYLDRLMHEQILSRFDHRNINEDVQQFAELVPTTENVVAVIGSLLRQHWAEYIPGPARLYRVHIQETSNNGFEEYFSEHAQGTASPQGHYSWQD